jgi:hypothetical protein
MRRALLHFSHGIFASVRVPLAPSRALPLPFAHSFPLHDATERMTANRSSMFLHAAGFLPAARGIQGTRAASRPVALPVSGGRLAP